MTEYVLLVTDPIGDDAVYGPYDTIEDAKQAFKEDWMKAAFEGFEEEKPKEGQFEEDGNSFYLSIEGIEAHVMELTKLV